MVDNTIGAVPTRLCISALANIPRYFFRSPNFPGAAYKTLTMALFAKCLRIGSTTAKHGFQAFPQLTTAKYSVYPPHYAEPVYKKQELDKLYESGEIENYKLIPFKAARSNETCSIFHDPIVAKFINYMLLKGQKKLAREVLEKTFEKIKKLQLEKYNRETDPEKKAAMIVDPVVILKKAVANCRPLLKLTAIKRGGSYYQVPVPITDKESTFYAMRWFVQCGREKDKAISFADFMATELIKASNNDGKVVKKKLDLHRQCEANRAYAHYRWS